MTVTVILGHPNKKSFNYAIFESVVKKLIENGYKVYSHDLYEENFNPIILGEELATKCALDNKIKIYCNELLESDGIVIIHPNWWGQPPAILKEWIDRVLRPKIAYDFEENDSGGGLPIVMLKGKTGIVFNTSNTEETRENNVFGDPLENIWKKCIFEFCGIEKYYRKMFRIIADSCEIDRIGWLNEISTTIDLYFPLLK